jgi:inner membrane protein
MIVELVRELGPWNWWILALVLLGLEILAPGTFFLWFGISAFVIGTISLAVGPDTKLWVWQTQMIGFVVLSLVSALAGRRFLNRTSSEIEDPFLNERGRQLVGRTAMLEEPILEGQGRARFGDTMWRISGPDLPAGARIKVVDAQSNLLIVAPEPTNT